MNKTSDLTSKGPYLLIPSFLVTVIGIMTNLLSLSYFVTQRKSNGRLTATEALNKKLFITLNIFDILVCIFLTASLLSFALTGSTDGLGRVFMSIFTVVVQFTGYITCLLAVIRAISIIRPRHNFNRKLILAISSCFGSVRIILEVLNWQDLNMDSERSKFAILTVLFIVVIFSNIVCIAKLMSSQLAPWKRNATITMGILSLLYCTLNTGFLVVFGFHIFKCPSLKGQPCINRGIELICVYILLPLNSACDPIVYFVRNAEMRKY